MNITKILKARRQELGISQDTLAQYLGFSHRSSVHRLENNTKWPFEDVVRACELLKLELTIKKKE